MSGKMIVLEGTPKLRTALTDGTVNPGHLLSMLDSGKVVSQTSEGLVPRIFATDQSGTTVTYHVASAGDVINAKVAAGADAVAIGNLLMSSGDGTLELYSTTLVDALDGDLTGTNDSTLDDTVEVDATHIALDTSDTYADADVNTAVNDALDALASDVTDQNTLLISNIKELQATMNEILPIVAQFPMAMALDAVDNSEGLSEAYIRVLIL